MSHFRDSININRDKSRIDSSILKSTRLSRAGNAINNGSIWESMSVSKLSSIS